nr:nucleolar protein 58-like [Tanacetum cinerariifolium]
MGITIDCGPIKTGVKHLFGGVVRAMMSPEGSIITSLENISGFLAVNTPSDDLICTDFEQEGAVPKVMLHIFDDIPAVNMSEFLKLHMAGEVRTRRGLEVVEHADEHILAAKEKRKHRVLKTKPLHIMMPSPGGGVYSGGANVNAKIHPSNLEDGFLAPFSEVQARMLFPKGTMVAKKARYKKAVRKSDQMHQTLEKSSVEMTRLNTCSHDLSPSFKEVPSFNEPEPQPQPLPCCSSLDISLGDERGPKPPIKPHSLDSFRMNVVDNLTTHTPPSSHVASFYLKDCLIVRGIFDREKMSRDVLTVGSTMRILLLYRGKYSQWVERFMNYLEEQTDREAMINSIKNGDQPLPRVTQVFLNNLQPEWKQYGTMMRQNKNLMDINIDALYNTLKQNQGDVNDAMGLKKKNAMVTSDPLTLIAEKTKVSKDKEKVVVSSDSEGSDADDFCELKKITALLAKSFNRRKFYSNPTNNNLRTSSTSQSANKKQEFVKSDDKKVENKADEKKRDMSRVKCYNCKKEGHFAKDCKKAKVKDYNYYKTKMLLAKKDSDEQVLLAEDQALMESSSDSDQEINANMVFMAQIKKVLSDSEATSSSADEKISKVLKDQLQVKHVVIDTHVECQEKYANLEAERYVYMIRYSAYFDNDKQHRKQIADQEVLYDKMSV